MGHLLHSCVDLRTAIKLSFGMVSGVAPGIDGGPRASREWTVSGIFWHLRPHSFEGVK